MGLVFKVGAKGLETLTSSI